MVAGQGSRPGVGASRALNDYWTKGKGLAKWAASPTPYTALVAALREHVPESQVHGLAAEYYHMVFGVWPGRNHSQHNRPNTSRPTPKR
ncbi:hypothetical protein [Nocardia transvalensis]|uniref:hypothetical protein n=1 Tax=Nocardia transvalensis TaxID=37333 RepID=UPI001894BED6|nr:hypothetical protein [Nocardia transvalensis]MBF6332386.1 hypothetical protein [Nocardia transvalensis]